MSHLSLNETSLITLDLKKASLKPFNLFFRLSFYKKHKSTNLEPNRTVDEPYFTLQIAAVIVMGFNLIFEILARLLFRNYFYKFDMSPSSHGIVLKKTSNIWPAESSLKG
jgi:hypothetical protein